MNTRKKGFNFLLVVFFCLTFFLAGCGSDRAPSGEINSLKTPTSITPQKDKFPADLSQFCSELPEVEGAVSGELVLNFGRQKSLKKDDGSAVMSEAEYYLASDQEKRVVGYVVELYDPNGSYYGRIYEPENAGEKITVPGLKIGTYEMYVGTRDEDWNNSFSRHIEEVVIHHNETTDVHVSLSLNWYLYLPTHILGADALGLPTDADYRIDVWHKGEDGCNGWEAYATFVQSNKFMVTLGYYDFKNDASGDRTAELVIWNSDVTKILKIVGCAYNLKSIHDGIIDMKIVPREEATLVFQPQFTTENALRVYSASEMVRYRVNISQAEWSLGDFLVKREADNLITIPNMAVGSYHVSIIGEDDKGYSRLVGSRDINIVAGEAKIQAIYMDFSTYSTSFPVGIQGITLAEGEELSVWQADNCESYGDFFYRDDAKPAVNARLYFKSPLKNETQKIYLAIKKGEQVVNILGYVYNVWDIFSKGYVPLLPDPDFQSGSLSEDIGFAHDDVMFKVSKYAGIPDGVEYVGGDTIKLIWNIAVGPYEDINSPTIYLSGKLADYSSEMSAIIEGIKVFEPRQESGAMEFSCNAILKKSGKYTICAYLKTLQGISLSGTIQMSLKATGAVTSNLCISKGCDGQNVSIIPSAGVIVGSHNTATIHAGAGENVAAGEFSFESEEKFHKLTQLIFKVPDGAALVINRFFIYQSGTRLHFDGDIVNSDKNTITLDLTNCPLPVGYSVHYTFDYELTGLEGVDNGFNIPTILQSATYVDNDENTHTVNIGLDGTNIIIDKDPS